MENNRNKEAAIANHVFTGSTTMIGVSITVIALFRIMHTNLETYADDILGFDNLVFIAAAIFAYSSIRKDNNKMLERFADAFFLLGMIIMLIVGIMIVYK